MCELRELHGLFPVTASHLAYAYALSGRFGDSMALVERLAEPGAVPEFRVRQSRRLVLLGEVHLLAGRTADSSRLAEQALARCRDGRQHGDEALALHLLGEIASHHDSFEPQVAEDHYHQALSIATDREMRPLVARCHLGLGKLHRRTSRRWEAAEHLTTATTMFREMAMGLWLEQSEAAIKELQ